MCPLDNLLGTAEVKQTTEGFKGVMATFDATRPAVAASAIGIGRAALEFVREALDKAGIKIRYGIAPKKLTTLERDFMDMEANLQAARLLTWRASWMMDEGMRNSLEASMAKAKAGLAVTKVTQKAVELLGPLGLLAQVSAREVDAGRQDQRHLRGHAADQHDDHRPPHPRVLEQRAQLKEIGEWKTGNRK